MLLLYRCVRFVLVLALLLCSLVSPRFGWAVVADPSQKNGVDPFYGSFGTEIPIEVPAFHGLEPQLALNYSSSGGNGWIGMGWGLGGVSSIERAGPNRSYVTFTDDDAFYLDGSELIPCDTQGGEYCTKIHNFSRIEKEEDFISHSDGTLELIDEWTVVGTNGNEALYQRVIESNEIPLGFILISRYALRSVTDLHGNRVNYDYWCDLDPVRECYLDRIHYNGNEITFYSELRPDPILSGSALVPRHGRNPRIRYRLKSIAVRVDGQLARAYALQHDESPVSGFSRLVSVQQFGSDAVIAGDGSITGGTALPAQLHQYAGTSAPLLETTSSAWGPVGTSEKERIAFADFNGDGMADHIVQDVVGSSSVFKVALSTGNGFAPLEEWGSHGAGYTAGQVNYADVNGDGRTDLIWHGNNDVVFVSLSLGDEFSNPQDWGSVSYRPHRLKFGDMTGDGKADLVYADDTGHIWLRPSDGDHFATKQSLNDNPEFWSPDLFRVMDRDADGLADVVFTHPHPDPEIMEVHYADTSGTGYLGSFRQTRDNLIQANLYSFQLPGEYAEGSVQFVDLNQDGRGDLVHANQDNDIGVYLSTGSGFEAPILLQNHGGSFQDNNMQFADLTGDGRPELIHIGNEALGVNASYGTQPDLMTVIENGVGGRTEINYAPSTRWWTGDDALDQYLPLGFVVQTVESAITYDGRGGVGRTDYNYAGGLWSDAERRFLGFRKVTGVIDAQGNYTETYYHQHDGCISKPEETYFYTNDGKLMSFSDFVYTPEDEVSGPPFVSLLTERWDYECQEAVNTEECRKSLVQFSYDAFGNVVSTYEYGDYDLSGDERTRRRTYTPNLDAYITGYPATEEVYAGIVGEGESGTLVEYREFYYDGASDFTTPPTHGLVTTKRTWNSQNGDYEEWLYGYDRYGNLVSETDPRGATTTRTFDPIYHVHPTSETNALGHSTSRTYDYTLGLITFEEDPNGFSVTTTYDALGRRTHIVDSEGKTLRYEYHDLGDPNLQHIREIQEDGSADGLWAETYQDGIGREYKKRRKGGFIQETQYFETSKRKSGESFWHHESEPAYFTYYQYDNAQRLQRTIHPDGNTAEVLYDVKVETRIDENGNEKTYWRDAYGRIVQVRENDGTSDDAYTNYEYDALDRLTQVIDAHGNITSMSWDSLGNRTEICEPNTGCTQSTYEPGGLLSTQTDAKGQVITYIYDALGRVLGKQRPEGDAFSLVL